MITLKSVANIFHTEVFKDAYGTATFKGCLLPYADEKRSASAAMRRILEVLPEVSLPDKMTMQEVSTGQVFLLSVGSFDFWNSSVLRRKIPVIPVFNNYNLQSIAQVLSGSGGVTGVYIDPNYVRNTAIQGQSDFLGGFELVFSSYYSALSGTIVYRTGEYYRLRQDTHIDDLGFNVAEAVTLSDPVQTQTVVSETGYDPESESSNTDTKSVSTFVEPYDLDHTRKVIGFQEAGEGDLSVSVLKSAVTVKIGDTIGPTGKVIAVVDNGDIWTCQVRRNQV